MGSSVEQAGAQLADVAQQQSSLAAAVAASELWMEAGAAARCDQVVRDIDDLLASAQRFTQKRKFGDNEDGIAAAERFAQAGQDYIDTMMNAQRVFANMAATYRAAGRTVAEIDAGNEQMFRAGLDEGKRCANNRRGTARGWLRCRGVGDAGVARGGSPQPGRYVHHPHRCRADCARHPAGNPQAGERARRGRLPVGGKPITLRLERDKDTVAAYQARRHDPAFTSFADNTVNGRVGVHLSVRRERTDCAQLMDGGPVSLTVAVVPAFSLHGPPIDSCAAALRIAEMIEPRLPKAGAEMAGAWDAVADVLGFGGPSGNDHGSSGWAAWGHPEIRSMLDTSVDPGDIGDAARAWREQGRNTTDAITGCIHDLDGIVSGGWRGVSADAAITALPPID